MILVIYSDEKDMFGNDVMKLIALKHGWNEKFQEQNFAYIGKTNGGLNKYAQKDLFA
jgi:hypothetical protein